MLVFDENLPASQRQLLHDWRIGFRVGGVEVALAGAKDQGLIPVLQPIGGAKVF